MKEIRSASIATNEQDSLIVEGRPIVYDTPTTINASFGSYTEIIKRGALDNADLSDIRLLYNHDANKVPLARTPKTMSFELDSAGLTMRAALPDTEQGKSVHTAVGRGDLTGMSFAFKVAKDGSHYDAKTNTRSITKIEKVYECSIVPFPAYENTTVSVEARSQIDEAQQQEQAKQALKIKINQIQKRGI